MTHCAKWGKGDFNVKLAAKTRNCKLLLLLPISKYEQEVGRTLEAILPFAKLLWSSLLHAGTQSSNIRAQSLTDECTR